MVGDGRFSMHGIAFRNRIRKVHPNTCNDPGAQEETKRLNDVFEVLKEPSLHKLAIIFKSVRLARALKKVVRVSDLERKVTTLTNRKWS